MAEAINIDFIYCKNYKIGVLIDLENILWFKEIDVLQIKDLEKNKFNIEKTKLKNINFINFSNEKNTEDFYINEKNMREIFTENEVPPTWFDDEVLYIKNNIKLIKMFNDKINIKDEELKKETELRLAFQQYNKQLQLLEKTDIIYVLTNNCDLSSNIFKIGKTTKKNIKKRLSAYNTGKSNDKYFYVYYREVYNAINIENTFHSLMNKFNFKDKDGIIRREIYKIYIYDLILFLDLLIENDSVNSSLYNNKHEEIFLNSINKHSNIQEIKMTKNKKVKEEDKIIVLENLSIEEKKILLDNAIITFNSEIIDRRAFENYLINTYNCEISNKFWLWTFLKENFRQQKFKY